MNLSEASGCARAWVEADAYLFDIDGTLLNAYGGAHYNAFHSALEQHLGLTCKIDGLPLHGNTDRGILRAVVRREGLPESGLEERFADILQHMCAEVERNRHQIRAEACPGVLELVRGLHSRGKLLGVASGNLESIGWIKLQAAALLEYFTLGAFSDHLEAREHIFAHGVSLVREQLGTSSRVCVIGDTPADIAAARAVSIPVIAVATGIYSVEQLKQHAPDICVSTCLELAGASAT